MAEDDCEVCDCDVGDVVGEDEVVEVVDVVDDEAPAAAAIRSRYRILHLTSDSDASKPG